MAFRVQLYNFSLAIIEGKEILKLESYQNSINFRIKTAQTLLSLSILSQYPKNLTGPLFKSQIPVADRKE